MEAEKLLRNPEVFPSNEVLKSTLRDAIYDVLDSFVETIANKECEPPFEWRFYNDGKAWLDKVVHKKNLK